MDENLIIYDSDIGSWLSLIHFPDETRVQLTKKGRRFIFQNTSALNHSVAELVGRAKWNQYRSNTEVPIPLGTIKTLLGNSDRELFLSSFSVIAIGSQKLLIPIKLPIKIPGSPVIKILALLCLSRNVFNTGNFQTDNQKKAEALIETFKQAFNFELPSGVNKRGNYIRIPQQFILALNKFFTDEDEFKGIFNIISSLNNFSNDDVVMFLNTWFSFFRIYRNIKRPDQLFIFRRKNEVTEEIAKLLEKCEVEFHPGTIQESGNIISAFVIKNTPKNHEILDLSFLKGELEEKPDHLLLIKSIIALKDQINQKDEKINVLEKIITNLNSELVKEQESKLIASYSRFYFESQTQKLEEKFRELKQIREELEKENWDLRRNLQQSGAKLHTSVDLRKEIDLKELSESTLDIVKSQIIESEIYNSSSFNAFIKYVKQKDSISKEEAPLIIQGDEEGYGDNYHDISSEFSELNVEDSPITRSNLTNPILTQKLIKALTLMMARKENWILLAFAFDEQKNLTEFELRDLLGLELSESRPLIANLIKNKQLEYGKVTASGEGGYSLKNNLLRVLRDELNILLRKKTIPADIKSQWKEIFQLY